MLERAGVDPSLVGQVVGGCIDQVGAQAGNITRIAWLAAGLPQESACTTVDSACGSSQQAFNLAVGLVGSGAEDIVMACGVENMSTVPLGTNARGRRRRGTRQAREPQLRRALRVHVAVRGRRAHRHQVRHQPARRRRVRARVAGAGPRRALDEGRFEPQIVPIEADAVDDDGKRTRRDARRSRVDEVPRETSLEAAGAASSRWPVRTASTPRAPAPRSPTAPAPCC